MPPHPLFHKFFLSWFVTHALATQAKIEPSLTKDVSAHLISQGQAGEHAAACVLSDSIIQLVSTSDLRVSK